MNNSRYSCQIQLPEVGQSGQRLLKNSHVLLIGAGGLGCPIALYLCSAGIGKLTLVDPDIVEMSNLSRQVLYCNEDLGKPKVLCAQERLNTQNCAVHIDAIQASFDEELAQALSSDADLVIDATDQFTSKTCSDAACEQSRTACIIGSIQGWQGQIVTLDYRCSPPHPVSYRTLFGNLKAAEAPSCSEMGVLGVTTGLIGILMAVEAIKCLLKLPHALSWKLLNYHLKTQMSTIYNLDTSSKNWKESLELDVQDLPKFLDENQNVDLIDVRTLEERAIQHMGGRCIPLDELESLEKIDTSQLVVCYCRIGARAKIAADHLSQRFPGVQTYYVTGEW